MLSGSEPGSILSCVKMVINRPCNWAPPPEYLVKDVSSTVIKIVLGYNSFQSFTIVYPFEMYACRREGVSLQVVVNDPEYFAPSYGTTHVVDSSAILNGDKLHVFVTNRSLIETAPLEVHLADGQLTALESGELLTGPAADSANTIEQPNLIVPQPVSAIQILNGAAAFELPPLSVAALTFLRK